MLKWQNLKQQLEFQELYQNGYSETRPPLAPLEFDPSQPDQLALHRSCLSDTKPYYISDQCWVESPNRVARISTNRTDTPYIYKKKPQPLCLHTLSLFVCIPSVTLNNVSMPWIFRKKKKSKGDWMEQCLIVLEKKRKRGVMIIMKKGGKKRQCQSVPEAVRSLTVSQALTSCCSSSSVHDGDGDDDDRYQLPFSGYSLKPEIQARKLPDPKMSN